MAIEIMQSLDFIHHLNLKIKIGTQHFQHRTVSVTLVLIFIKQRKLNNLKAEGF